MPHGLHGHGIQRAASHEDDQSDDRAQDGCDVAHNGEGYDKSNDL